MTVPNREPIKIVADILKSEMIMGDGQLMLGLENWRIPANTGLYIALFYGSESTIGSTNEFDSVSLQEIQTVAMLHTINIDAMSFDDSARLRKEEIIMALGSMYAQNHLDLNLMKLGELPQSFIPLEELEDTKQLNKYRLTFVINALHQKVKTAAYYDTFQTPEVTSNG